MANKSNLQVTIIPEGQSSTLQVAADTGGFLTLTANDGKGASVTLSLSLADIQALSNAIVVSRSLRTQFPG